jgi:hypothetical protein
VNDQSAAIANSIRPDGGDEPASHGRSLDPARVGRAVALRGSVRKRPPGASGGWRRNGRDGRAREAGRPVHVGILVFMRAWGAEEPGAGTGVRVAIVAVKRRNGRGAKGRRKVKT